jgi:hypothetical protein
MISFLLRVFVSSWPVMPLLTGLLLKAVTNAGYGAPEF